MTSTKSIAALLLIVLALLVMPPNGGAGLAQAPQAPQGAGAGANPPSPPKPSKRIALVIGQDAYPGGGAAVKGLPVLYNSRNDAKAMAALLARHGIEVIKCGGGGPTPPEAAKQKASDPNSPGCFDLDEAGLTQALGTLEAKAKGADLALVFYAGHGMDTHQGNVLAPVDAKVDCATGDVTRGVLVERLLKAIEPARQKLVVLDACRDNPLGEVCPNLKGKKLPFAKIEAGARSNFLLVTSTQFGQEAQDGPPGTHSPFATALLKSLEQYPAVYFDQVLNEVARATTQAVHALKGKDVLQVPGRVVGGAAPADCLSGKDCIGDNRMAALRQEVDKLAAESQAAQADAAGVRAILAEEEVKRGKPYTAEERSKRVSELEKTLASIAGSAEPKVKEAGRLLSAGKVAEGRAKLDEALDDDEKAAAEIERMAAERRKTLAKNARDAARLAVGSDVVKALTYYQRATRNDPSDAQTWHDYARAAVDAGKLDVARNAFEQAALRARDAGDDRKRYWATLGLGDLAEVRGDLPSARRLFEAALAIVEPLAKAKPDDTGWQRDLSSSYSYLGDVLVAEGNLPEALKTFRDSLAIHERLASADKGNSVWQRDLWVSHNKIGGIRKAQGDLAGALTDHVTGLQIVLRLTKINGDNAGWQRDLSISQGLIGDVLVAQGNLPEALKSFREGLSISERLALADKGNAGWQRDLILFHGRVAGVLARQRDRDRALGMYREGRAIIVRLKDASPTDATLPKDLAWFDAQIAALEKK
jgi:uncharacterized caspase-like protein